jgi:hypothetical protein
MLMTDDQDQNKAQFLDRFVYKILITPTEIRPVLI